MDDISKARTKRKFDASASTKHLDPKDSLIRALDAIESGEINAYHCIVVVASMSPDADRIGAHYYSAGPLDHWGHIGLMVHALDEIKEG